jgi:hypothetical protein
MKLILTRYAWFVLTAGLLNRAALGQTNGGYDLHLSAIAGGGGTSSDSGFSLSATVGQPTAATSAVANGLLAGGFWGIQQTPGAPWLTLTRSNSVVVVSWPLPADGWVLEQASALGAPSQSSSWTPVSFPYETNSTHIYLRVSPAPGGRFYRLRQGHGQGTVLFANSIATAVSNALTLARVPAGSTFLAALYFASETGTSAAEPGDSQFTQIGAAASFASPGVFNDGTRTAPTAASGGFGWFQVRVWEACGGASYEAAMAAGFACGGRPPMLGRSNKVRVDTGDPTVVPPEAATSLVLSGLKGFYVGPSF